MEELYKDFKKMLIHRLRDIAECPDYHEESLKALIKELSESGRKD